MSHIGLNLLSDKKKALNEAIDALGDIPAENCTNQQKNAYNLCVEAREELTNNLEADNEKDTFAHYSNLDGVCLFWLY